MAIVITIFKSQLSTNPRLIIELAEFASEVTQVEEAFIYVPKQGQVVEFINLLSSHTIAYNINSDGQVQ